MWIVIGGKTRAQRIPDGRVLTQPCRPCGKATVHAEHDVCDELSAFWVKVAAVTQRRMVCMECGEDLSLEEASAPAPASAAAAARVASASADDLLAALKKKMGL